jgi:hypothetical protein
MRAMKPPAKPPPPARSPAMGLVGLLLKTLWVAFVVTTPVLGVWLASSLAAYSNGPLAAAVAVGLLLFPGLPLAWEGWAARRRKRRLRGIVKPRILTFGDRFILRTLALNLLFLGVLLAKSPATAFAALSTRGDWMLEGRHGERAEAAREILFRAADRLEWLYLAFHENPFDKPDDGGPVPSPSDTGSAPAATASTTPPGPVPTDRARPPVPAPTDRAKPPEPPPDTEKPSPPRDDARRWPAIAELHPTVKEIPSSSEQSIHAVARYIHDRESDPFRLVKALHDYVADRVAYDAPALASGNIPPQDAETVFRTRKGVCAGYARLLAALGKEAGVEIRYVVGDARTHGSSETGNSHAWNAAKIDGRYYLIDATWDSGSVDGSTFVKGYRTEYLFTPPEVFGLGHFPKQQEWQLRATPISRGDFFRQPMMQPSFFAEERVLLSPTRSQVSVHGSLDVTMRNPRGLFTLASFGPPGSPGSKGTKCLVEGREEVKVHCVFPREGRYEVSLFSNTAKSGTYHFVGQVEANSEP